MRFGKCHCPAKDGLGFGTHGKDPRSSVDGLENVSPASNMASFWAMYFKKFGDSEYKGIYLRIINILNMPYTAQKFSIAPEKLPSQ